MVTKRNIADCWWVTCSKVQGFIDLTDFLPLRAAKHCHLTCSCSPNRQVSQLLWPSGGVSFDYRLIWALIHMQHLLKAYMESMNELNTPGHHTAYIWLPLTKLLSSTDCPKRTAYDWVCWSELWTRGVGLNELDVIRVEGQELAAMSCWVYSLWLEVD